MPPRGGVVSELESLGDDISREWARHSDDLAREFEALSDEIRKRANQAGADASGLAEEYGQRLQDHLDALSESIRMPSSPTHRPRPRTRN